MSGVVSRPAILLLPGSADVCQPSDGTAWASHRPRIACRLGSVAVFEMATVEYALGDVDEIDQLYPPAEYVDPEVGLRDRCDVIAHYTRSSLRADGFTDVTVGVRAVDGRYVMRIDAAGEQGRVDAFARHHTLLFGPGAGLKAIKGRDLMERFGVWNPMAGFRVNDSSHDGESKWCLFPPLGLNVIGQKAGILQHYPPWQVVQQASDEGMMTWARWHEVLGAAGIPDEDRRAYGMFIDVNPIAAPGSGESEYPNDYLPIMAASAFFDGGADRDYIVSMLDLCLNPPGHDHPRYTLPLLVGGSPLYDPQAPGWFRVRYKYHLPTDGHGIVQSNVLQSGVVRIRGDSARETPYIIGNHMIAAGVTGRCTDDPSTMPDIRLYEAQDLVAASFLHLLAEHPGPDGRRGEGSCVSPLVRQRRREWGATPRRRIRSPNDLCARTDGPVLRRDAETASPVHVRGGVESLRRRHGCTSVLRLDRTSPRRLRQVDGTAGRRWISTVRRLHGAGGRGR
jgi:hypothetical protein